VSDKWRSTRALYIGLAVLAFLCCVIFLGRELSGVLNAPPPPIVVPTYPNPRPQYAVALSRATACFGSSKDDVVSTFGAPDAVGPHISFSYDYKMADGVLKVYFSNVDGSHVDDIYFDFNRPTAVGDIWEAVFGIGAKPPQVRYRPSVSRDDTQQKTCAFSTPVSELCFLCEATSNVSPVNREYRFDTETNQMAMCATTPNPSFKWRDTYTDEVEVTRPSALLTIGNSETKSFPTP